MELRVGVVLGIRRPSVDKQKNPQWIVGLGGVINRVRKRHVNRRFIWNDELGQRLTLIHMVP